MRSHWEPGSGGASSVGWHGMVWSGWGAPFPSLEEKGRQGGGEQGRRAGPHTGGDGRATTSLALLLLHQPRTTTSQGQPTAKDSTACATRGWFSFLLWYNHWYYKQRKNNFKNRNKLIKGHYWKAKTESGSFFRDRFQQYLCIAFISFLSLDLRHYIKSSCQAKQLFVTPGKWLYRHFMFSFALSLRFRASAVLCAGAYTPGRTESEKYSFPQGK